MKEEVDRQWVRSIIVGDPDFRGPFKESAPQDEVRDRLLAETLAASIMRERAVVKITTTIFSLVLALIVIVIVFFVRYPTIE